jgi:hypothetical protein
MLIPSVHQYCPLAHGLPGCVHFPLFLLCSGPGGGAGGGGPGEGGPGEGVGPGGVTAPGSHILVFAALQETKLVSHRHLGSFPNVS